MSDIEAEAKLDVGQVLQGLRSMTSELDKATLSMKKLNDQGAKTKSTLQESLKGAGQVAGKAGGPLGSFSSKILTGSSMDGIFGRMAAGIGVATLGFRAYQAAVDASLERVRLLSEAHRNLRAITDQTEKAVDAKARRGEAQMAGRMAVIAAGGKEAAQKVDEVTGTGLASHDDASRGIASIYGRFGNTDRARNATNLAATGAAAGLNFAEVAQQLTKMGAAVDDASQTDRIIGRMLQKQTGRQVAPETLFKEAFENIEKDPYLSRSRQNNQTRSVLAGSERDAFLTSNIANKDRSEGLDPGSQIQVEAFKKLNETMDDLRKMAKEQGPVMGFLANVFQPAGSFETQLRRIANATAAAQGLAPRDEPTPVAPVRGFGSGNFMPYIPGTPFGGGR